MGYGSWAGPPFGGIRMDFSGGMLSSIYESRTMNFMETNGEICNSNGDLLFYSNGIYIANAENDTMVNGGGINSAPYTTQKDSFGLPIPQGNLIIPFPGDSNKYYLFHETCDDYGNTYCTLFLYCSIIDMSLDSGRGAVIQKNIVLLNDSLVEGRLTACKHANGRDWWLVTHQNNTNRYYKFLITPGGIQGPYTQDIGVIRDNWGQAVFSPDGTMYAYFAYLFANSTTSGSNVGDLDIFNFDRCTGDFSMKAHVALTDSSFAGGVAFSSNSNVLYVSSSKFVWQFDMTSTNIPATQSTIAMYDGFLADGFYTTFYLSQLAPDGKIYINTGEGTRYLHVINHPDSIGSGCDVCQHCIQLLAYNAWTIANHPNYFLGAESGSVCDSITGLTPALSKVEGTSLHIFPNPVSNYEEITFAYPSTREHSIIIIYNIEGNEVARYLLPQWSSVQHVTLPKLSSGVYLARLISNRVSGNVKFFVE